MRYRIILYFLFISLTAIYAQTAADGETFFNNKKFSKAKDIYESLLKRKPNDQLYNYRYARCLYELKDYQNSIKYFELSGTKFPLSEWYLSELYFKTYRFDESVMAYQNYIATLPLDDKKLPDLEKQKNKSELAAKLMQRIEDIAIVDSVIVDKNNFIENGCCWNKRRFKQ